MKTLDELLNAVEDDLNRLAAENAQLLAKVAATEQQAARLRAFVGKVREAIKWWNDSNVGDDQLLFACKVDRWIGELDAVNHAPITEPVGGAG